MNYNDIHLIKGSNKETLLFYPPTFTLLSINNILCDILEKLINHTPTSIILREYNLQETDLNRLLKELESSFFEREKNNEEERINKEGNIIKRITLHVSNDCNLRCCYCYAHGGNYQLPRGMMSKETASNFISFCCKTFDKVENIVFFGGEPLMNLPIIEYICKKFRRSYEEGEISYIPKFGIITNGTILNNKVVSLIQQYIANITVSIDGPKNVNDYNRRFANGSGSYERISDFIQTMKEKTEAYIKYEATYTSFHQENELREIDIKAFLKSQFDIDGTVVHEMNFENYTKNQSSILKEEADIRREVGVSFPEGFFSIVNALLYKKRKEMCLVGSQIVSISIDGEIYPCHLNTGMKKLSLGDIYGENIFNSREKYLNKFPYLESIYKHNGACNKCWAYGLCGGCTYRWFFDEKKKEYNVFPNLERCKSNRKHIEEVLLLIAYLRKNTKKWNLLLELLRTKDQSYFNG